MPTFEQPNFSGGGIDQVITSVTSSVPIFTPMLLLFVYFVVMIGGMQAQIRATGNGDTAVWSCYGAICSLLIALGLSLGTGGIGILALSTVVILCIISAAWLFLSRDR